MASTATEETRQFRKGILTNRKRLEDVDAWIWNLSDIADEEVATHIKTAKESLGTLRDALEAADHRAALARIKGNPAESQRPLGLVKGDGDGDGQSADA